MQNSSEPIACVAFMLIADHKLLVEKRAMTKQLLPGAIAIPGGHVDAGENLEETLLRELHEELNVVPLHYAYLCALPHQAEEFRLIHYFIVEQWSGEINALEAEQLHWLPLDRVDELVLEIDREAVVRYLA